jgi:4-alpha-glucanotransferase
MRNALGPLGIVAENLGVITPEVETLRCGQGFPGMAVLQFEVGNPAFEVDSIERNCVCYTGTHDNDTTRGWFLGTGDDTRTAEQVIATQEAVLARTGGTSDSVPGDMIELAFSSPAALAIAPMQDFLGLGSEARLNTPGTTSGNWCWRMREGQIGHSLAENTRRRVHASSRAP